jgi:hypothetical protein
LNDGAALRPSDLWTSRDVCAVGPTGRFVHGCEIGFISGGGSEPRLSLAVSSGYSTKMTMTTITTMTSAAIAMLRVLIMATSVYLVGRRREHAHVAWVRARDGDPGQLRTGDPIADIADEMRRIAGASGGRSHRAGAGRGAREDARKIPWARACLIVGGPARTAACGRPQPWPPAASEASRP